MCLKSQAFLKQIFKSNIKLFSEFLITLSKDNEEFTIISCTELTSLVEDLVDDKDLLIIYKAIIGILKLKDAYQIIRFEILFGIPQLTMENLNYVYKAPLFGYHNLKDPFGKLIDYRGTYSNKDNCGLLKKLMSLRINHLICDLLLSILDSASDNPELLKYLVNLPAQEPCHKE